MLKPVEQHFLDVVGLARFLGAERVPVADVSGRVLAQDVTVRVAVPPFTNSAMDGFAVRAAEVEPGRLLPVSGDIPAGTAPGALAPGTAMRIMTGSPLPEGADAVLKVEDTDGGMNNMGTRAPAAVVPTATVSRGANVRAAGGDVAAGTLLYRRGQRLGPADVGALISVGYAEVECARLPRVGIVATGEELRSPGEALQPGQIPDSNSYTLAAVMANFGALPVRRSLHADTVDGFLDELDQLAGKVDVICTSGGVSAGAFDVVKAALRSRGVTFEKVNMQPGKPQGYGRVGGVPIVCVPGNPVSSFVSAHLFVLPLLQAMMGEPARDFASLFQPATVTAGWSRNAGRIQFQPIHEQAGGVAPASHGGSASHFVASLGAATGLAMVPADQAEVPAGTTLPVHWFGPRR